jgi:hypothetical protein
MTALTRPVLSACIPLVLQLQFSYGRADTFKVGFNSGMTDTCRRAVSLHTVRAGKTKILRSQSQARQVDPAANLCGTSGSCRNTGIMPEYTKIIV